MCAVTNNLTRNHLLSLFLITILTNFLQHNSCVSSNAICHMLLNKYCVVLLREKVIMARRSRSLLITLTGFQSNLGFSTMLNRKQVDSVFKNIVCAADVQL